MIFSSSWKFKTAPLYRGLAHLSVGRWLYDKGVKLITLACLFSGLLAAQPAQDPTATARKAVDLLVGEKYTELFQMFSPTLQAKEGIPMEQLLKVGETVKKWGALE